jgi:transposase
LADITYVPTMAGFLYLEHFAGWLGRLRPYFGAEVLMGGAYSKDLRGRVLAAIDAGGTPQAAARRFAVGRSTAYRWAQAARVEGRRQAKPMRGGPAARITGEVEAALLSVAGSPDHPSLGEIAALLAEKTGVRVHLSTVYRALRRAGWT